ncbi:hypothetical protein EVAR_8718_1 [Eumeta japonica]|uniref:Uncharacterized protein n=1 Tax=Eumeta variegata TaxID=151549 RepID=A0A4C1XIG0_EUMVA|nr:hypothetical protein EVAR_8718_1 [Eumeta japonica]
MLLQTLVCRMRMYVGCSKFLTYNVVAANHSARRIFSRRSGNQRLTLSSKSNYGTAQSLIINLSSLNLFHWPDEFFHQKSLSLRKVTIELILKLRNKLAYEPPEWVIIAMYGHSQLQRSYQRLADLLDSNRICDEKGVH